MPIRDLLKKKDKVESHAASPVPEFEAPPTFRFMRSDTSTQEIISPPNFPAEDPSSSLLLDGNAESKTGRLFGGRSRSASVNSQASASSSKSKNANPKRLSARLHFRRSEQTSESVPSDLPEIRVPTGEADDGGEARELLWEKRATMLAQKNEMSRSRPATPVGDLNSDLRSFQDMNISGGSREKATVSTQQADDNIQEAIRLHEAGDLVTSTKMFGRLANPHGENNALSQVLYGLALRHGWGCTPNPAEAVTYLSAAASNAASIEELALKAGMKKGGAAKGELVLAIFELANCFRHGWGVQVDKFAAKQYYETAANLGDTDAMNEVAWCYVEGFGCKKDKYAAAKYYRLAEAAGSKTLGNSWYVESAQRPISSSAALPKQTRKSCWVSMCCQASPRAGAARRLFVPDDCCHGTPIGPAASLSPHPDLKSRSIWKEKYSADSAGKK
ncbi:hypothetical protein B2J93_3685 [Marssonina coronariae]|uniref:HCP-like protein n=1 Tax=Diplocarpon coronariae TaxID=2795749 RepID=A0A218Z4R9_9HELO|nr:hypothetical protein B2J93_3685 [Marssonina coronariae]